LFGFFENKKILIIGGTGTIGQGLISTILEDNPAVIRIFSRDEYKQFEMQQKYRNYSNLRFLIGDIRDAERLHRAMQDIDYVFHVAAMKHVPACEYNPFEAVQTNILGTQNVIQASLNCGVKKTVLTSTDKAISPTNTYGASKLMAERLIASAQYHSGQNATIFAAVRFGNVMGSRGSVVPLFKNQIEQNRCITVTDSTMSRFMMTVRQATDLTIGALKRANGGEVFVLKMPVIKLNDLAEVVIDEVTRKLEIPKEEIGIEEIGFRPGEKMYEELMTMEESRNAYEYSDMFVIPNLFKSSGVDYQGATRAKQMSYSSTDVEPISRDEIRKMLISSHLI
jgi:UDP-N-acetylglucosamine 4,6-dehydratase